MYRQTKCVATGDKCEVSFWNILLVGHLCFMYHDIVVSTTFDLATKCLSQPILLCQYGVIFCLPTTNFAGTVHI